MAAADYLQEPSDWVVGMSDCVQQQRPGRAGVLIGQPRQRSVRTAVSKQCPLPKK